MYIPTVFIEHNPLNLIHIFNPFIKLIYRVLTVYKINIIIIYACTHSLAASSFFSLSVDSFSRRARLSME